MLAVDSQRPNIAIIRARAATIPRQPRRLFAPGRMPCTRLHRCPLQSSRSSGSSSRPSGGLTDRRRVPRTARTTTQKVDVSTLLFRALLAVTSNPTNRYGHQHRDQGRINWCGWWGCIAQSIGGGGSQRIGVVGFGWDIPAVFGSAGFLSFPPLSFPGHGAGPRRFLPPKLCQFASRGVLSPSAGRGRPLRDRRGGCKRIDVFYVYETTSCPFLKPSTTRLVFNPRTDVEHRVLRHDPVVADNQVFDPETRPVAIDKPVSLRRVLLPGHGVRGNGPVVPAGNLKKTSW